MRPLKLHTKTTLLASAITLAVLATALLTISARIVNLVREDQKLLAEKQASSLAEHISSMPQPRDAEMLASTASLVRAQHPNIVSVRIWERSGGLFVERAAAAGSLPATEIPEDTKAALRTGMPSKIVNSRPTGENDSHYRVFAPISDQGRVSGAVEVVERLDDVPSIAGGFVRNAAWIALAAVMLITLAIYLLFRYLIYRPIESLLNAMSSAKEGALDVEVEARAPDEIGSLSLEFNSMIGQIREMTNEREAQQHILEERVSEATAELQERNEQLEDTNLELWHTTRRLTELERLAAAGQTAAQFAHEVGTPLNLISGHVQLLRANLLANPQAAESRLQTITEQIERIERIVRQMLDRTRTEAAELTPLDLNELLRRIFDTIAPALDERGVRLKATLCEVCPPVAGDADRLQQAFINLINNAFDAMPDGGELHVTTSLAAVDEMDGEPQMIVDLADTGCGMNEEIRSHIFDAMYTTKKRGRGTGLGLVVVRQVMNEHGGSIEVSSQPERGSRFRLSFPVAPDERETVMALTEESAAK
ncbi:MAG TPA: ATP-binding protein [Pyrinomonadaceae bacterium]